MLKQTQYSKVSLEVLDGIPVAAKKYHSNSKLERYELERDILLELNGKFRTPRLLACDDGTRTLYIEWIAGDRLKEYVIRQYLGLDDIESNHRTETIIRAQELFKDDGSPEAMNIKTQMFSIVRLLHRYGIVHGDLSTRNFIITPDGFIFVIDFSNGRFAQSDTECFYEDINRLEEECRIHWSSFERRYASYLRESYYQSCAYPNGFISSGDGQGSTYRKFRHLGIKDLGGFSFLDVGCAEGEICRYAYRAGAKPVLGIDISDNVLTKGGEINRLYGYHAVTLKKGDIRNLAESTGGQKYDVVTCFSVLHHLLPHKSNRDILAVVTDPDHANVRGILIALINEILSVTNQVLFLELPFEYLGVSASTLETGCRFTECVAPDIKGSIRSLGIWHANAKKARFIFRIGKPGFSLEISDRILLSDPVLDAWHRNIPMVPFNHSRFRVSPSDRSSLMTIMARRVRSIINYVRQT